MSDIVTKTVFYNEIKFKIKELSTFINKTSLNNYTINELGWIIPEKKKTLGHEGF